MLDEDLILRWCTSYDLVPAYLEYVQPPERDRDPERATHAATSNNERDLVLPSVDPHTESNLFNTSSHDPFNSNALDSGKASVHTLSNGPCSTRSED